MSRLTRHCWELLGSLWAARNDRLHSAQQVQEHSTLVARIRALYSLPRSSFPRAVARRFIPIQDLLQRPLASLQAWLAAYDAYYSMYTGRPPGSLQESRRRHADLDPQFDPDLHRRQREARHARAVAKVRHYWLHLASRLGPS